MEMEDNVTDEIVVSTHLGRQLPELKSIVSLITCSICYGHVKEPLTTSVEGCGHTFCSICVRGYLTKFQQQCPQCLKEIHDRDLLKNRPLKAIAQYIQSLVPKLEKLIIKGTLPLEQNKASSTNIASGTNETSSTNEDSTTSRNASTISVCKIEQSYPPNNSGSAGRLPDAENIHNDPTPQQRDEDQPSTEGISVSCPVCQITILPRNINNHLDTCLGRQEKFAKSNTFPNVGQSENHFSTMKNSIFGSDSHTVKREGLNKVANEKSKPARMNKVVYYLMKDAELKKLLKKEGLDIWGDRKSLISRHQRFTVLWNSHCDSDYPLSRVQIINLLKREEQNLSEAASSSPTTAAILSYDRNTRPEVITSKQQAYLHKNKSQFAQLIHQVKARKDSELNKSNLNINKKNVVNSEKSVDIVKANTVITKSPVEIHDKRDLKENSTVEQPANLDLSEDNGDEDDMMEFYRKKSASKIPVTRQEGSSSIHDDIRKLDDPKQEAKKDSDSPNAFRPGDIPSHNSSTPRGKKLTPTKIVSNVETPMRESSEEDSIEENDSQVMENEPVPKRRKSNKLSLSRRHGAGSTKKTPCPVCQDLVRESLINFHLDNCLGKHDNTDTSSAYRKTRSVNQQEKEKYISNINTVIASGERLEDKTGTQRHMIDEINQPSSADMFKEDSEEELNFPLSQLDHNNSKLDSRQVSQTSAISSSTIKLLNVTPDIIETSDADSQLVNFTELIDTNLDDACFSEPVLDCNSQSDKNCLDKRSLEADTAKTISDEKISKNSIKENLPENEDNIVLTKNAPADTKKGRKNKCAKICPPVLSQRTTRSTRASQCADIIE